MEALNKMIQEHGRAIGNDIIKVDSFLNHRIDTPLLFDMGRSLACYFAPFKPEIVLTIEASGIALAITTAHALGDIPVIFAKKSNVVNKFSDMVQAEVRSFTRRDVHSVGVERTYIPVNSRVLIVDDFLADGCAAEALISIVEQTHSKLVGIGIGIEKNFQQGAKKLRDKGMNLFSLAIIDAIEDGQIVCR